MNIANNNMAMPACVATISNSQKIIEFIFYKYFPSFNTICNDKSCNNIVMTSIYIKTNCIIAYNNLYTVWFNSTYMGQRFYHTTHNTHTTHTTHTHTQIYTCAYIDTHMHTSTYACKHVHTHTHRLVHTHTHRLVHTHACTRTSTHTLIFLPINKRISSWSAIFELSSSPVEISFEEPLEPLCYSITYSNNS